MYLKYYAENNIKQTEQSNEDLEIIETKEENSHTIKIKALKKIKLISSVINTEKKVKTSDLYFLNGYQTWTDTKEFMNYEREKDIRKILKIIVKKFALDKYGDSKIYDYNKNKFHSYDVFYAKGKNEFFIFNKNITNAYLIIEIDKANQNLNLISDVENIELKENEEIDIFNYAIYENFNEGLNAFKNTFEPLNKNKIFGYTSWYNYYQNINQDIINRDLDALDNRFELFQIDDGYETFVGDWMSVDKNKFPDGLKVIVDKIHQKGMKAGIWLAPFIAEEKSNLFINHKDLFLKDSDGNYIKCGGNWSGFYALDLQNPNTIDYIKKSFEYHIDLGFDFFKLDFLYATNVGLYKGLSRCQATNKFYSMLREILKDRLILGCGATLINGYKKFDFMRIGPDISLIFDDKPLMRLIHRERISTKVALQNTIYRSIFNDTFFGNDPDVFLLRDYNIKMNKKQKVSLVTINALFGNVLMTSDNVGRYKEEEKEILTNALEIFYNATDKNYKRDNDIIHISYTLNGKEYKIEYNTKNGVMKYE